MNNIDLEGQEFSTHQGDPNNYNFNGITLIPDRVGRTGLTAWEIEIEIPRPTPSRVLLPGVQHLRVWESERGPGEGLVLYEYGGELGCRGQRLHRHQGPPSPTRPPYTHG